MCATVRSSPSVHNICLRLNDLITVSFGMTSTSLRDIFSNNSRMRTTSICICINLSCFCLWFIFPYVTIVKRTCTYVVISHVYFMVDLNVNFRQSSCGCSYTYIRDIRLFAYNLHLISLIYEIYFTWMAPKAARNAVSLYEGASPWVTGLNLDHRTSTWEAVG